MAVLLKNNKTGESVPLVDGFTIGRVHGQLKLSHDEGVSAKHCLFRSPNGIEFQLLDQGSRNGTYVNGKRLKANQLTHLSSGDIIELGAASFTVFFAEEVPQPAPANPHASSSSLDNLLFDSSGLLRDLDREGNFVPKRGESGRFWKNDAGDSVVLLYAPFSPEEVAKNVKEFRASIRKACQAKSGGLVEADLFEISGTRCQWSIQKFPEPAGFNYAGNIDFLFRDFHFELYLWCLGGAKRSEREDAAFHEFRRKFPQAKMREPEGGANAGEQVSYSVYEGWRADPYDPALNAEAIRNFSDNVEFDKEFPEHPLSRTRRYMKQFRSTARFSETLALAPKGKL